MGYSTGYNTRVKGSSVFGGKSRQDGEFGDRFDSILIGYIMRRFNYRKSQRKGKKLLAEGGDVEYVITFWREGGAGIIDSIKFLREIQDVSLAEAKRRVHFSHAWEDRREDNERLHKEIVESLEEIEKNQIVHKKIED